VKNTEVGKIRKTRVKNTENTEERVIQKRKDTEDGRIQKREEYERE
jgi:hypothetical protein